MDQYIHKIFSFLLKLLLNKINNVRRVIYQINRSGFVTARPTRNYGPYRSLSKYKVRLI